MTAFEESAVWQYALVYVSGNTYSENVYIIPHVSRYYCTDCLALSARLENKPFNSNIFNSMDTPTKSPTLSSPSVVGPFSALAGLISAVIATALLILGTNWVLDTGIELSDSLFLLTPMYVFWALQRMYEKGRKDEAQRHGDGMS